MEQKKKKGELLIAGVGGWGIVTIGNILANAALKEYKNIAWFPSYATMMRGGESDCCVSFSQERIASPIMYQSSGVIVLGESRLEEFKKRVKPGGLMLIESTGIKEEDKIKRDDIEVRYVSVMEEASRLGRIKNANLVMLGVYIGATALISEQSITEEIESRFKEKKKVIESCKEAFLAGVKLAA